MNYDFTSKSFDGFNAFLSKEQFRNLISLKDMALFNYQSAPNWRDVLWYATYLGMNANLSGKSQDNEFIYVAIEALKAPLPAPWKIVKDSTLKERLPCSKPWKLDYEKRQYFNIETSQ